MQIVDILGLLVPNIWTAITQLCATAVLFFALYKLAYKPVKKILDEVAVDDLYFKATGGGVTFGGGEPLLRSGEIVAFTRTSLRKN